jgi:hypothetical protein
MFVSPLTFAGNFVLGLPSCRHFGGLADSIALCLESRAFHRISRCGCVGLVVDINRGGASSLPVTLRRFVPRSLARSLLMNWVAGDGMKSPGQIGRAWRISSAVVARC